MLGGMYPHLMTLPWPRCIRGRRFGQPTLLRSIVLVALIVGARSASADEDDNLLIGRVTHVADGDTLTLVIDDTRYRIRLAEIDAPEYDQPWSDESRDALADKVAGKYVRVAMRDIDDYGRIVGTLSLGARNINREMVREGHAWAYRQYLKDQALLTDEAAARKSRRGIWSIADPVPPWRWRHGGRESLGVAGGGERSAGCDIKGNINRRGDHIYHEPDDRHYRETQIDPARGERWFCTAAEAEQAGWRRAR